MMQRTPPTKITMDHIVAANRVSMSAYRFDPLPLQWCNHHRGVIVNGSTGNKPAQ